MKKARFFLVTVAVTFTAFAGIIYSSCQKTPTCSNVCLNGSSCANGICRCLSGYYGLQCQYTKIIYWNNSFTNVKLHVATKHVSSLITTSLHTSHDTIIYIKPFSTAEYYGVPNDTAIAAAYTFGPYGPNAINRDSVFGEIVTWDTIKTAFLAGGSANVPFDVRSDYFFLILINNNAPPIGNTNIVNIDVNPTHTNTWDTVINAHPTQNLHYNGNITVTNDSFSHNIGYFGSNGGPSVVTTDASGYQITKNFGLNFGLNQTISLNIP